MRSIWNRDEFAYRDVRESLCGDGYADVAVIGGGMAGICIAYTLSRRGVDTVVLEAARVGEGITSGTTAKITAQHGLIFDRLAQTLGEEKTALYASLQRKAVERFAEVVRREKIDCAFERKDSVVYSRADDLSDLEREARAVRRAGFDASFSRPDGLPFPVRGAMTIPDQAQFHPLAFLRALAARCRVYEHSRVLRVENDTAYTEHGRMRAKVFIVATHYPFINVPGLYFLKIWQERSHVLALEGAGQADAMYIDAHRGGWSLRSFGDTLLFGGENALCGSGEKGAYRRLAETAKRFYPESGLVCRWSAQDCMTPDGLPYVGVYAPSEPNWYVATGFNKWGMSASMAAALLLCDEITGKDNPCRSILSPRRALSPKALPALAAHGLRSASGLAAAALHRPSEHVTALKRGEGGVVMRRGKKVGVFKDEKGQSHIVDVICPHLGCELVWNRDEATWDCPCHGSRFSYTGRLLCGPAQEDLKYEVFPRK